METVMNVDPLSAAIFIAVVIIFLIIDLKSHSDDKPISLKNAAVWSAIWVVVSLMFAGYVAHIWGIEKMSLFLAGYFLEKSLAVDNLFVFMAIFASFSIEDKYQHRVLYYGIVGAIILRFIFIAAGTSLLWLGGWVLGLFGLFVLWTAWKMWQNMRHGKEEITDYTNHWSVRYTKRVLPVHTKLEGHNFLTKAGGGLAVTPLFLCLVCIEMSDVMFAFDSVPAVIAVTQVPFLVYTSNIFAILGLRSLYFLLSAAKRRLVHLEKAVIGILAYIGVKMLLAVFGIIHISAMVSLFVVLGGLLTGVLTSLMFPSDSLPKKL
ncbi:MAG: TerC/Alx family metal homeostasis membrane protein [Desulfobacterales bacterium]|nr:TerC/Alx family metal homeostasis membrane protein [Desulfobacterales bacterium]